MENTPEVASEQHEPSRLKKFGWGALQGAVFAGLIGGVSEGLHALGVPFPIALSFDLGPDLAAVTAVSVFAGARAVMGNPLLPFPKNNSQEN